jgi:hypothetical protein
MTRGGSVRYIYEGEDAPGRTGRIGQVTAGLDIPEGSATLHGWRDEGGIRASEAEM